VSNFATTNGIWHCADAVVAYTNNTEPISFYVTISKNQHGQGPAVNDRTSSSSTDWHNDTAQ
jgi:hypothetical protein